MSEQHKQLFTLEEANQRLPLVKSIVRDIVSLFHDTEQREERLQEIRSLRPERRNFDDVYTEEVDQVERELDEDRNRLRGFVDELQSLGVELKDPAQGLVDFRSESEGREVYLCWKHGEDDIAFWHELNAGFAGRQPLLATASISDDEDTLSI